MIAEHPSIKASMPARACVGASGGATTPKQPKSATTGNIMPLTSSIAVLGYAMNILRMIVLTFTATYAATRCETDSIPC